MSATQQPVWVFKANLGDSNPIDYGGYFIYEDKTGVYPAEATLLETDDNNLSRVELCSECGQCPTCKGESYQDCVTCKGKGWIKDFVCQKHANLVCWREHRIVLEPCTLTNGVLSNNKFHPLHHAWFASDLESVASTADWTLDNLQAALCSQDPIQRAHAYRDIAAHHGVDNFDSYPIEYTAAMRDKVEQRFVVESKGVI